MSNSAPASSDDLKARIRAAGLRCTAARLAVLQHMLSAAGPETHADVSTALADHGFDRATIYRNLMELTEAKLVTRVDLGDHVWRFEMRRHHGGDGHAEDHPHFVCTSCGEVSCLDDVSVAITPRPGAARSAAKAGRRKSPAGRRSGLPAVTEVLLKGTCENCE